MKASDLFHIIKQDMERLSVYKSQIEQKLLDDKEDSSIGSLMTRYNYQNLQEILNTSSIDPDFVIDDAQFADFEDSIDHYLGLYARNNVDLARYIKVISAYLAFIVHRPLHPPGLRFSDDAEVYEKGGKFYCSGKRKFIKEDMSLCKYCVCKAISTDDREEIKQKK